MTLRFLTLSFAATNFLPSSELFPLLNHPFFYHHLAAAAAAVIVFAAQIECKKAEKGVRGENEGPRLPNQRLENKDLSTGIMKTKFQHAQDHTHSHVLPETGFL